MKLLLRHAFHLQFPNEKLTLCITQVLRAIGRVETHRPIFGRVLCFRFEPALVDELILFGGQISKFRKSTDFNNCSTAHWLCDETLTIQLQEITSVLGGFYVVMVTFTMLFGGFSNKIFGNYAEHVCEEISAFLKLKCAKKKKGHVLGSLKSS